MIRSTSGCQSNREDTERLLGCSRSPLPSFALPEHDVEGRITALLEWMISGARGSTGAVLLPDEHQRLAVRAAVGLEAVPTADQLPRLADLEFGLIVHGADMHEGLPATEPEPHACPHHLIDNAARMVVFVPLAWGGRTFGAVQIGFTELRTLEPPELRQLRMIADHIACVAEAARLEQESAERQAEITRVNAVLDGTDRIKGEFLSMISHELRTPLTAIIGYTDLLLRQIHGPLSDRQTKHQTAVKKAAHRLLGLINDLLDVNRMESGHVTLNPALAALNDAVHQAVAQLAPTAEQRGVELRLDAPLTPVTLVADAERLQQIVANLLDNAIKFTPTDGTVTVRIKQQDDAVTVSVIDTGIGVPPEQLERIWDRFHQADAGTRRKFGGTGLGLAIVRHLVELHGGTVSVASSGIGEGSTFRFTLPTTQEVATVAEDRPTANSPRPTDTPPHTDAPLHAHRPGRTVLIVDDEPDNREVIASIVQDVLGHRAVVAANGPDALAAAESRPDVILLDLRMPGMSGFEVARTLRNAPHARTIPIVAITALNDDQDRLEALEAGCDSCVTKPFTQEALAGALSAALAARSPGTVG
jgi:signal transduction histidine kinase/ActR/RegA family two-component response regulator